MPEFRVSSRIRGLCHGAALMALFVAALGLTAFALQGGDPVTGLAAAAPLSTVADDAPQHIPCADCHREHRGHDHKLTSLSDSQCEVCHTNVKGFPADHPAFKDYPYDRRTRINYDHVGHEDKYFAQSKVKDAPEQCTSCHEPDSRGEQMLVKGFETACAACHAGPIRGEGIAGSAGIAVITIPGLDLTSLRKAGVAIGGWPELSDRKLTPFMRALFSGDPDLGAALKRFDKLDPLDLRDAKPEDIQAVSKIAWATKDLFYDLISQGPTALQPKLSAALGPGVDDIAAREMLGGITLATVRAAQSEWFPDLFKDVSLHRAGKAVPIPPSQFDQPAAPASTDSGNGSQEDILGGDSGSGSGSQEDILGGDTGGDSGSQEDILGGDSGGGSGSQEDILGGDSESSGDQEDILGGSSGESSGGDILSGGEESGSGGDDVLSGSTDGEPAATGSEAEAPKPNPESWTRLGGWYHDYFALLYRPGTHADRFLKRWLEVTATAMGGKAKPVAAPIFDELSADGAPGQCMKCHSADAGSGGGLVVNWQGKQNAPHMLRFTRFVHAPHLPLLTGGKGCADCHSFDKKADYVAGFDDHDPKSYSSNFQPIAESACDQCHVKQRAGNACVECHLYHGGHVAGRMEGGAMSTELDAMASNKQ